VRWGKTIEPTITSGHLRRFRGAPSISRRLTVESGTWLVSLLPAYMRFSLRPRDRSNERERPLRAVKAYFALAMERAALARTPVFPRRPLSDAALHPEQKFPCRPALAVRRRVRLGEARQPGVINAAEFAVDVSCVHPHIGERRDRARIFVGLVEAGPSQKLHSAVIDARGHAKAVEFDFMQPLRPRGRLLDRLGKLRRDEARKRDAPARGTGRAGPWARTLDGTRHAGKPTRIGSLAFQRQYATIGSG